MLSMMILNNRLSCTHEPIADSYDRTDCCSESEMEAFYDKFVVRYSPEGVIELAATTTGIIGKLE